MTIFTCLVASLLSASILNAADQTQRVEIQHQAIKIEDSGDPEVVMYHIMFDLRISNLSKEAVTIGQAPVVVADVQNRMANGSWRNLNQNSWYDDGTAKYASCFSLSPGKTVQISNVETGLTIMKKRIADVGSEPVLRFKIQILCRDRAGQIHNTEVLTTDPTVIRLPPSVGGK
jgi:hypothetical protein